MVVVGVLIEGDEGVGFVAGVEDFSGAEVDLENGWPAGDGARDGHVGHDVLGGGTGELCEEAADRLDAVLGVSGEADDGVSQGVWGGCRRMGFRHRNGY